MAPPIGRPCRSLEIDDQARATVTAFFDSIGYDAVDVGPLADSWRQEPGTPVYRSPYGSLSDETGTPAGAAKIRAALTAARVARSANQ
jgi:hypothetical protein